MNNALKDYSWLLSVALLAVLGVGCCSVEVEGVISAVGQRTITFQMERKGKVREEVVGVDDKTKIEKSGANIKLRELQETDKALINYEPEAYTPAIAIKVTGKGEIQKVGGDD